VLGEPSAFAADVDVVFALLGALPGEGASAGCAYNQCSKGLSCRCGLVRLRGGADNSMLCACAVGVYECTLHTCVVPDPGTGAFLAPVRGSVTLTHRMIVSA
jgi:hypothetical protein